jgi:hypothetical protein
MWALAPATWRELLDEIPAEIRRVAGGRRGSR